MKSRTVPKRELATYGVEYPTDNLTFEYSDKAQNFYNKAIKKNSADEKYTIESKRIKINVPRSTFENLVFEKCNFHSKGGAQIDSFEYITFEKTDFVQCMLGTNKYFRVIFKKCTFYKCDFKDAEFVDCTFIDCTFKMCTAYHCRFSRTEIEPKSFLGSIVFPSQNFQSISIAEKEIKEKEWKKVKLFLANQLFVSNKDLSKSNFMDEALLLMKEAAYEVSKDEIVYNDKFDSSKKRTLAKAIFSLDFFKVISLLFSWLNLKMTDGGTSFKKLFFALIIIIFLLGFLLSYGEISYLGKALGFADGVFSVKGYLINVFLALPLFLTYGYSDFVASNNCFQVLLVIVSLMGLVWYALAIQVLIRKIYI